MDGLSFAASLITVIQLAESCLKLSRKWLGPCEFKSADLATVTTNLYGFIGVMKSFQTHLNIHEDDTSRLSSLEKLSPALKRCEEALEVVQDFIMNGGLIGKQAIGPMFDRKLKDSLKALQAAKELFEFSLHADNQVILKGVERYTRNLAEDFRDFRDGITASLRQLHEKEDKTYVEVKRGRKEQDEWQNTASETALSIKAIVDRQDMRGDRNERRAILDWLTPVDYAPQQNDFINRRQAGTGEWFLDSSEFQTWLQAANKTLFCPGMPGSGKTILTSIVIDKLKTYFADDKGVGIAYIYFNFRRKEEQKADILFASLLKQLAQGILLPESVKSLHDRHKQMRTQPSLDEILRTLQSVAAMYSKVFIIVDALDECQTSEGCRTEFLSQLLDFQAKRGANLFVTSRVIGEITEKLKGSISLEIRASDQDVRKYVDGRILRLPSFVGRNPDLQREIQTQIVKAVDGMFLLAQLHLDSLIGKRSPKALRTALTKLRSGSDAYDYAYNNAMERIEGQVIDHEELAKQVLTWIIYARRPLTIVELQHALAVEVGERTFDEENMPQIEDMVSVCAGLVTIDNKSRIIRLVHYTTQEYFLRTQNKWFPNAQSNMTLTCVTYLSFNVFKIGFCQTDDEFEERLRLNPLYDYAAHNWGHHARDALNLCEETMGFLECDTNVEASSQALMAVQRYYWDLKYSQKLTGLHLAAYFGVEEAVKTLLARHSPDFNDCSGRTPLSYAAANGHKGAVQQLLLATDGVDVDRKDEHGGTPLLWAAKNGHESVVELLLAQTGINPDRKAPDVFSRRTPLSFAAENGHDAVVKSLLATGCVDTNSRSRTRIGLSGLTPLLYAARNGHKAVVELLLAADDIDPESATTFRAQWSGRTPLSLAAGNGHEAVVKLLLAHPSVNSDSKATGFYVYGRTPLSYAAEGGHEAVVQLLLARPGLYDSAKHNIGMLLSLAARNGHEVVVRILLAIDKVDVNSTYKGRTALFIASENGQESVVRLLLATDGVDVNFTDSNGQTALISASVNCHEAVVRLLLATKIVDINTKDSYGQTALLFASRNGHEAVVRLLLAADSIDINFTNSEGQTALLFASENGHEAIVRLLLNTSGIDVNSKNKNGRTPLSWAAANGYEAVVKVLLENGKVDVGLKDDNGWTPLLWATIKGKWAVVKLLRTDARSRELQRTDEGYYS